MPTVHVLDSDLRGYLLLCPDLVLDAIIAKLLATAARDPELDLGLHLGTDEAVGGKHRDPGVVV